jgi:transmembrane sensor
LNGLIPGRGGPLEEAAVWFAELAADEVDPVTERAWERWLQADSRNAVAWARVEEISARFTGLPASGRMALARRESLGRRRALKVLGLALGGLALGWARPDDWRLGQGADLSTAVGEIRAFDLAAGVHVWLNTDSQLARGATADHWRLLRGEALFESRGGTAPMVLEATPGRVRFLAGCCAVQARDEGLEVAAYRGALQLLPRQARPESLAQGARALMTATAVQPLGPVDPGRQLWRQGRLVVDDWSMAALVAELGRYRPGLLTCTATVAQLRVVGSYPLADTDRALAALADSLPVRVERRLPWWVQIVPA